MLFFVFFYLVAKIVTKCTVCTDNSDADVNAQCRVYDRKRFFFDVMIKIE